MAEHLMIFGLGLGNAWNHLFRNNQNMRGGLRLNVSKSKHQVVLIYNRGGDFAGYDFFKKRFAHAGKSAPRLREHQGCSGSDFKNRAAQKRISTLPSDTKSVSQKTAQGP